MYFSGSCTNGWGYGSPKGTTGWCDRGLVLWVISLVCLLSRTGSDRWYLFRGGGCRVVGLLVVCWVVFCSELIGIIFPGFCFTLWEGGGLVQVRVSARD